MAGQDNLHIVREIFGAWTPRAARPGWDLGGSRSVSGASSSRLTTMRSCNGRIFMVNAPPDRTMLELADNRGRRDASTHQIRVLT